MAGITRQAVNRAVKLERVHLTDGKVDPDHPTNRHFLNSPHNRRRAPRRPPAKTPMVEAAEAEGGALDAEVDGDAAPTGEAEAAGAPPGPAGPPTAGPKTNQRRRTTTKPRNGLTRGILSQLDLSEIDQSESGIMYKNQVDVAKSLEQIKTLQLKNEKERNELISRDLVKRVFGELFTIETTELLSLGEKISPEIAALFGLDDQTAIMDVTKLIQLEISKSLDHIESTFDKFLKSFQVEGS